jgi:hypothetical protein
VISNTVAVTHNDVHNILVKFEVLTGALEKANIPNEGLFLIPDEGFDSKKFWLCSEKNKYMQMFFLINGMSIQIDMSVLTNFFISKYIK